MIEPQNQMIVRSIMFKPTPKLVSQKSCLSSPYFRLCSTDPNKMFASVQKSSTTSCFTPTSSSNTTNPTSLRPQNPTTDKHITQLTSIESEILSSMISHPPSSTRAPCINKKNTPSAKSQKTLSNQNQQTSQPHINFLQTTNPAVQESLNNEATIRIEKSDILISKQSYSRLSPSSSLACFSSKSSSSSSLSLHQCIINTQHTKKLSFKELPDLFQYHRPSSFVLDCSNDINNQDLEEAAILELKSIFFSS